MSAPAQDELIDRVDDGDHVIGVVARRDVFAQRAGFRVAHVLVFDELGRVVLQEIGRGRSRHPGRWGSSVAGYVKRGETPARAARRRMHEEIGLQTDLDFRGVAKMPDDGATKFVYVFTCHTHEQPRVLDPEHVASLRPWLPDELSAAIREDPAQFAPTLAVVLRTAGHDGVS